MVTLSNGVLTDATGRTGYIASNYQLQFDAPPQHGTLVDSGFSVCANGSLAIGDSAVFYQCTSGTFSNLYDRWWADQCSPVNLQAMPCGDVESIADAPAGKVVGTQMVQTTLVTVLKDGQPQVVPTVVPIAICQIDDGIPSWLSLDIFFAYSFANFSFFSVSGQIQGHTTPCAELPAPKPSAPAPPSPGSPEAAPSAPATAPAETTPATTVAPPASSSEPTPTDVAAGAARTSGVALVALVIGMAAAML